MTQVLKNRKGVTLVELLAVIVIMGIIAAIAVPAIGGLITNSKKKAVEGTITSIEEAARLYAATSETSTFTLDVLDTENYIELTGRVKTYLDPGTTDLGMAKITVSVLNGVVSFSFTDATADQLVVDGYFVTVPSMVVGDAE